MPEHSRKTKLDPRGQTLLVTPALPIYRVTRDFSSDSYRQTSRLSPGDRPSVTLCYPIRLMANNYGAACNNNGTKPAFRVQHPYAPYARPYNFRFTHRYRRSLRALRTIPRSAISIAQKSFPSRTSLRASTESCHSRLQSASASLHLYARCGFSFTLHFALI